MEYIMCTNLPNFTLYLKKSGGETRARWIHGPFQSWSGREQGDSRSVLTTKYGSRHSHNSGGDYLTYVLWLLREEKGTSMSQLWTSHAKLTSFPVLIGLPQQHKSDARAVVNSSHTSQALLICETSCKDWWQWQMMILLLRNLQFSEGRRQEHTTYSAFYHSKVLLTQEVG